MTRFRLNKSFEEELADKANEFRMEPSASMWNSIESSIPAKKAKFDWKIFSGVSGIAVIVALSFFLPTSKNLEEANLVNPGDSQLNSPEIVQENLGSGSVIPERQNARKERPIQIIDASEYKEIKPEESNAWRLSSPQLASLDSKINEVESSPEVDAYLAPTIQNSTPIRKKRLSKFQDGMNLVVNVSPQYSFRTLEARNDIGRPVVDQRQKHDQSINSINIGLAARYYFSNELSLSVGINYNSWGENIGLRPGFKNFFYDSLAEANGYRSEEMFQPGREFRHQNKYTHLEIPIIISKDQALGSRLSLSASGGIALTYTQSKKCVMYDYKMHHYVNNEKLLRNWNATLFTSLKLQYKIQPRFTFISGPELRYSFLSTYNDSYPMSQHQYALGWNFGLQWKLFSQPESIWSK